MNKAKLTALIAMALVIVLTPAVVALASGNAFLVWGAISAGGSDRGTATRHLSDAVGQTVVGHSDGTSYGIQSGIWREPTATYVLTIDVIGGGAVDPSIGLHTYPSDTVVRLTASPFAGWQFASWTINDGTGAFTGAANPLDITMTGNKTVTANFVPAGATLVSAIKQNPALYGGMPVSISGAYRGWQSGFGVPPVTRSDWVVEDSSGGIYVTGGTMGLIFPRDSGKAVTVNGTVRLKNGQPYVEIAR